MERGRKRKGAVRKREGDREGGRRQRGTDGVGRDRDGGIEKQRYLERERNREEATEREREFE